jgi:hypothetical protein
VPLDPEPPELSSASPSPLDEAVVAGVVAAHTVETHRRGRPAHTHCENCGAELNGPYCHQCGQHDFEFHRSFGHIFLEALENFFHFDAKFFRNIVTLLFRPGRLTADFNSGKRASQMPPFRLYLFVSVLFFLLTTSLEKSAVEAGSPAATAKRQEPADRAGKPRTSIPPKDAPEVRKIQTPSGVGFTLDNKSVDSSFEKRLYDKGQHAFTHPEEFTRAFVHALPKALLVCLPFFALITRVLFRRTGYVYLQHLVLAVHFHTFIFLWTLVRRGWIFLLNFASHPLAKLLAYATTAWLVVYAFLMLRHLFGNSWPRTIFKTLLLAALYSFTIGMVLAATGAILFLLL